MQQTKHSRHALVEPLHLAIILFDKDDSLGPRLCYRADGPSNASSTSSPIHIDTIRRSLQRLFLKKMSQSPAPSEVIFSAVMSQLLTPAGNAAKSNGDALIALDHFFIALYGSDKDVKTELTNSGLSKKVMWRRCGQDGK